MTELAKDYVIDDSEDEDKTDNKPVGNKARQKLYFEDRKGDNNNGNKKGDTSANLDANSSR